MRKDIPLHQYPKDVQIAAHMIGLNYKRPYIRHGRRYYKPYRDYFYSALSGPDYETLRKMEKKGHVVSGEPGEKGIYFWMTREGLDWLGEKLRIQIQETKPRKEKHMNNKIMAEKLRKLRGNKSRQEVAEACGISVSALAMYEAGERVPRDEIKIKLAKFYNRSVNYIFFTN